MEVSNTTSNPTGIQFSEDAKVLIIRLVALNAAQRADKNTIFNELYELWKKGGLGTISFFKEQFEINRNFIKTAIVMSMKLEKRRQIDTTQFIYDTLKSGINYTTSDGVVIPCTPEDLDHWTEKRRCHHRVLNRRFNELFKEFENYLTFRNEDILKPLDYLPRPKIISERENPGRLAKDKVLTGSFKGMTTNDSLGSKRKGKTGNSDQVTRVLVVFLCD
jgi:hypothetical protein